MSGSASGECEREWSHAALWWEAYICAGGLRLLLMHAFMKDRVAPRVLGVEKVCTK